MITREQIYAATDRGLGIFALYIENAKDLADGRKKFSLRTDDRDPSCSFFRTRPDKTGGKPSIWMIKDQGSDECFEPIAYHMRRQRIESLPEALSDLAARFGVAGGEKYKGPAPDIRRRPATADEADGSSWVEMADDFTDDDCAIMGPNVTRDHLRSLNWHPVKAVVFVKDRMATYRYSNDVYRIFARECWYTDQQGNRDRFYKVYEPKNADKGRRFVCIPSFAKPKDYINGLEELAKAFEAYNEGKEKAWATEPGNEGKEYAPEQLPEAVLCSGERDALCVRSHGYYPVWLNSETADLNHGMMKELNKYVKKVYNIPDIDSTGKRCGSAVALRHLDVHTVWLPDSLREHTDARGGQCKDLRDWMQRNKAKSSFDLLINAALPAKFWDSWINEKGKVKYKLSLVCLKQFLAYNGFGTYKDDTMKEPDLICMRRHVVSRVDASDVLAFVESWAAGRALPLDLRDLISDTRFLRAEGLKCLSRMTPNFKTYTERSQRFYFDSKIAEVTAESIKIATAKDYEDCHVWDSRIIHHEPKEYESMFKITDPKAGMRSEDFDIDILDRRSKLFCYLINVSRIHWRKELEQHWYDRPADEKQKYCDEHKFDIAGPLLSPEDVAEQKLSLINKIFMIGYMLHRHKSPSCPWAPMVMDNSIVATGECNGGSGKSFMLGALSLLLQSDSADGRDSNIFNNKHWNGNITKETDLLNFDDLADDFPFDAAYSMITGDMIVNPKYVNPFKLDKNDTPKFAFSTNFVPRDFHSSSVRRCIYVTVSDYYHQATEFNDYRESRTIADDFGMDLHRDNYPAEDYSADIGFLFQCLQFYLKTAPYRLRIQPSMDNIYFRKNLRDVSDSFRDWAEQYFDPNNVGDDNHLNRMVTRDVALDDYIAFSKLTKTTTQGFNRSLKAFCAITDYIAELNPVEFRNSSGRIVRKVTDHKGNNRSTDMIYIRTVDAPADTATPTAAVEAVEVETLPF